MEISGMTTLLDNDGKMTSPYKLSGFLIKIPWGAVNDSRTYFLLT